MESAAFDDEIVHLGKLRLEGIEVYSFADRGQLADVPVSKMLIGHLFKVIIIVEPVILPSHNGMSASIALAVNLCSHRYAV